MSVDFSQARRIVRERKVNMGRLKQFALENLPTESPLRNVLLSEADQLSARDFLAKMDLWLKLLSLERREDCP